MAHRLLDVVNEIELEEDVKPKSKVSPVDQIASKDGTKDKQISAKVNLKVYNLFTQINKAQGISNNSALNMLINKYVRENKGILDESLME